MEGFKEVGHGVGRQPQTPVGQELHLHQVHVFVVEFGKEVAVLQACGGQQIGHGDGGDAQGRPGAAARRGMADFLHGGVNQPAQRGEENRRDGNAQGLELERRAPGNVSVVFARRHRAAPQRQTQGQKEKQANTGSATEG